MKLEFDLDEATLSEAIQAVDARIAWYRTRRQAVPARLEKAWDKLNTALAHVCAEEYKSIMESTP